MTSRYDTDTLFDTLNRNPNGSNNGFTRIGVLRFLLPGHYDPDHRIYRPVELDGVVADIFEDVSEVDALAFEWTPGEIQQEHFLIGYSSDRNHERAIEKALGDGKHITDYGEDAESATTAQGASTSTATRRMREIAEEGVPSNIRVHECDVDLSPLGTVPVPTSRLLQTENKQFVDLENKPTLAIIELIRTLNERRIPYYGQTIITPAAQSKPHDFLTTTRLAVFSTGRGIVTEDDLNRYTDVIDDEFRISSYFPGPSSDNFALQLDSLQHYAEQSKTHATPLEQMDDQSVRTDTVEDLKSGFSEYQSLLEGRPNADARYRELFDAYGVIPTRRSDLSNFVALQPDYFDISVWGRSTTADSVQIIVEDPGEELPGTRQTYGTESEGDTQVPSETTDEESLRHQELVNTRVAFLLRQGHEILAVDQSWLDVDFEGRDPTDHTVFDDESRPDIVSRYDGQLYCHEIEVENDSKPSKLLVNLARGAYHGYPVRIVTPSKSAAEGKYINKNDPDQMGPIVEAYKYADEKGIVCYNLDATIEPSEDVTILLPSGVSESVWRHTPEETNQLIGDGEILAEGPADASVDTYTYNTPRVRKVGNEWVLESGSGEVIKRTQTKTAAVGSLTKAYKPFSLWKHEYIANTTVEYSVGDDFKRFEYEPEWALAYQNSNSRRYEEAVKEYIERVTVESEDATIPLETLRRAFLEWYGAQTDLTQPNDTWFGRAVNTYFDVDDSNSHNKLLENRQFRFSEDIISPDLPFISDEAEQ